MVSIKIIINLYYNCTLKFNTILMYTKFEPIQDNIYSLEGPTLKTASTKGHLPEMECIIRVLQDIMGALIISLP